MTTIEITDTLLAGNLGEGWSDRNEAADVYAEFVAKKYRETAWRMFPDAEISVDIRVEYDAEGCAPDAIVTGDGDSLEMARLEELLQNTSVWSEFLDSDAARELA
jgi:hypothetical protein